MSKPLQYPKPTGNIDLDAFLKEVWLRINNNQKLTDLELTATLEETITQVNLMKNMEG